VDEEAWGNVVLVVTTEGPTAVRRLAGEILVDE
jgi:hypothetical protein